MKEYKVLMAYANPSMSTARAELETQVNIAMSQNWKTAGGISIIVPHEYIARYVLAQAMVKEDE
jgi:hypothetical protein